MIIVLKRFAGTSTITYFISIATGIILLKAHTYFNK